MQRDEQRAPGPHEPDPKDARAKWLLFVIAILLGIIAARVLNRLSPSLRLAGVGAANESLACERAVAFGRGWHGCYDGGPLLSRSTCSPIASAEAPASIRRRMSLRRMSCWTICGIMPSFSIRRQI